VIVGLKRLQFYLVFSQTYMRKLFFSCLKLIEGALVVDFMVLLEGVAQLIGGCGINVRRGVA
jgi:hypothetical protein